MYLGAIKGEVVSIVIIKVNKNFAIGKILNLLKASKYRVDSICSVYKSCGGCAAHHIAYDMQIDIKKSNIISLLKKQGLDYVKVNNVIGMGLPYYYRNKAQYPVREVDGVNKVGFYSERSHNIVESKVCYIQNRVVDMFASLVFENLVNLGFSCYNEQEKSGDIRHIIIKRGYHTGQIMVVIVVNDKDLLKDFRFAKLVENIGKEKITSLALNLNDKDTNKIMGDKVAYIYGDKYITDIIGDYTFYISPKSFFQVNTVQTEILYNTLKEKLNLNGEEILFDLYSGVGTIGIFLSDSVRKVYGIEIEEEAVDMANMNIRLNNVTNCEYIAGAAEDKIIEFKERGITPDVIVIDPPRKGMDEKCIEHILEFRPKKIGYISCNPASLVRDLKALEKYYDITEITPVDMFPHTANVECVCVIKLR